MVKERGEIRQKGEGPETRRYRLLRERKAERACAASVLHVMEGEGS
jgi:hypothetical protein